MTMRSQNHTRRSSAGFTLVEVLIAALIMGMMFMSISKLMQSARQTRDTIHNLQETQLAGPAILEMLSSDIAGLFTVNRERQFWVGITDRTVNGLDADRIDFVTTSDSLLAIPDLGDDDRPVRADYNEVGYVLRPNPDNDEFLELYRREDYGIDEEPMRGGEYTFLTNQVKGFNIEVFEEDGPDAEPVDDWGPAASDPERIGLPAFAKITLTIELKPRIDRESMDRTGRDRRTIDYVRYVRFPERLRFEEEAIPRLTIPSAPGAAGEGDGTDPDDPTNDPGNLDPGGTLTGRPTGGRGGTTTTKGKDSDGGR